jgi:hypothetical protein
MENFVTWLKQQPFWENTTLVILGDHKISQRYISKSNPLNIFVNSKATTNNFDRKFTTYDYAPTIMEAAGYKIEKFGIGRSLFSSNETLYEKEGDKFTLLVSAKNELYEKMKDLKKTNSAYKPYKLGTLLNNKTIMNYVDFGDENSWCNKITDISMTLDKVPDNGVSLKIKYLKPSAPFSFFINKTQFLRIVCSDSGFCPRFCVELYYVTRGCLQ